MQDDLDDLKRSTDMVALLTSYGVELKQRGSEFDFLCIWHDESNPSAQVYMKDGLQKAHCKSCGQGGSVIDIVMEMDGVNEAEAIKRLRSNGFHRDDTRIKAASPIKPAVWQHETAPDHTPPSFVIPDREYQAHWTYLDPEGKVLGYLVRYLKPDGDKDYRPWTYGRMTPSMSAAWACKGWTSGRRPLYGLDRLAARPAARVMIVEGEKTADAAAVLMPGMVAITWPGGANGIRAVDWTPLAGRNILLVPDADYAGEQAMYNVAGYLLALGCTVRQLDTSDQNHMKGWDLADALADGWRTDDLLVFAEERITPLTSREIEKHRADEEKKTVQNANIEHNRPDDMLPSALLMEGEFTEAIEIPDMPPPNVVTIKPHTAIRETMEIPEGDPFSDYRMADVWADGDGIDWLYCHSWNKWLNWDGNRWEIDQTRSASRMVSQEMARASHWPQASQLSIKDKRALCSVGKVSSVLKAACDNPKLRRLADHFDPDVWLLGTPNGTIDLRTGILRESGREDHITKQTKVIPAAGPMPYWTKVIERCSMGDPEMAKYYQKWAGYTLCGERKEKAFLFVHGLQDSGKSSLITTMKEVLGEYAIEIDVNILMEQKFGNAAAHDLARLAGVRMAATTEPTSGHRWNEGLIKKMTGREEVQACRKYENPFSFKVQFAIWCGGNEKPLLSSADGMERRLHICEFPGSIPLNEQVDMDLLLIDEYPAILQWAIDGCLLWQKEGLSKPEPVKQAVREYVDTQDTIADWLGEKTEKADDKVKQTDLYRSYAEFVKAAGQGALGSVRLGPELKKRGYVDKKSNGVRYWYGLRLADHTSPAPSWVDGNDF